MKFEDFGINLAKARIKAGISAYELSLQLSKDASYINKVENHKINPSLKTIIAISECLKIDIKDLF